MSGDAALPEGQPGGGGGVDDGGSSSGSVQTTRTPRSTLSHYPIVVDASIFTHTPFYCEENVYYLCKKLCEMGIADPKGVDLFVVFISNEEKMIPLWHQKASQRDDGLVVWDYHVICIQRRGGSVPDLVWDMDSSLPFPVPLTKYFAEAIRSMSALQFRNSRLFRVVHAPIFLRFFASDRSHMKDTQGKWIALPPKYEPIVAEDGTTNNIDKYIKMSSAEAVTRTQDFVQALFSNKYGVIVGEMQLQSFFSEIQQ